MQLLISAILSVMSGVLLFLLKELLKDNRRLRDERKKENEEREAALKEGMVCLLRVYLIESHAKYMALGEISTHGYENFEAMYEAYSKLGGNGLVTHMWEDIQELRIKTGGKRNGT